MKKVLGVVLLCLNFGIFACRGEQDLSIRLASISNDTQVSSQWAINRIGLPYAWDEQTGSNEVSVAIIDSGIDYTHLDLAGNIDIDECYNFYDGTQGSTTIMDQAGHGTHVAGIIGAVGNNGIGVTGTCWDVNLISYKVMQDSESVLNSGIPSAINRARDNSIPIVNISIEFSALPTGMLEAIESYSGLVVLAAGNYNNNRDANAIYQSLSALDNVIIVGALGRDNLKTSWSSYGQQTVDLFAPGEDIYSTYPLSVDVDGQSYSYRNISGTSMAAPFVTGVAALVLSQHPTWTTAQIKDKILSSVEPNSSLSSYCVTGGVLNAYKAVHSCHDYTYSYQWINTTRHKAFCRCGESTMKPHVVHGGGNICLECGGEVSKGLVQWSLKRSLESNSMEEYVIILNNQEYLSYLERNNNQKEEY